MSGIQLENIQDSSGNVPDGSYNVNVAKAELRPTKNGDGEYVYVELTVTGGQFDGRKIFDRMMYMHSSQAAVDFGLARIKQISAAAGHDKGEFNVSMIHGKNVSCVVKNKDDNCNVMAYNKVQTSAPVQSQPMFNAPTTPVPQTPVANYTTTQPQAAPSGGEIQSQDIPF